MADKNKNQLNYDFKKTAGWKLGEHLENLQKLANKKPKEGADGGRKDVKC